MSISEFRKKKLLYVFNVFFDVNNSGEIDRNDFQLAIEKICELRGWPADHPKNIDTHECMFKVWEGLRSKADKDNDGQENGSKIEKSTLDTWRKSVLKSTSAIRIASNATTATKYKPEKTGKISVKEKNDVSVDEWCNMWDAYAKDPSGVLDWQQRYMNFMFDLEDASTDGSIDADEFSIVCSSYGLDKEECRVAFAKMSQGEEEVDRDQFAILWREYFSSDDPTSPGNFIFGKTSF